jgi:hypothetical protein
MHHHGRTNGRARHRCEALALTLALAGCTGSIPPRGGAGTSAPAGSGGTPPGAAETGTNPPAVGSSDPDGGTRPALTLPAGALRRLTSQQYANTVRDLLGAPTTVPALEPDPSSDDELLLTSVAVTHVVPSASAVDQYDASGRELARQVFADPARRQQLVGCAPAKADDPCIARYLAGFGRRAWRRPLSDDEIRRYTTAVATVAQARGDVWAGLETATAALLASPYFVYRAELGTPVAPGASRRALDDYELATRLSYTLVDTTPDIALLEAAGRGELLKRPEALRSTIERLLASPAARLTLSTFFSEWLGTIGLDKNGVAKDATLFPDASPALARGMFQEIEGLVTSLIFDKEVDFLSLYGTRETFLTAELARLYGLPPGAVPAGASSSPYTLPDGPRGGLLTTAAFLALNARASMTSPTLRGMFIRERLLCQHVPPPPPNVETTLPPPPPGVQQETMRQRLARHTADASCAGCHRAIDPLGLALETFDALGAFRTADAGQPIDVSGELDGRGFTGPQELQQRVREHEAAVPCLISRVVQHLTGTGDAAVAASTAAQLTETWRRAGGRLAPFLVSYLASDLFRTVEGAQ